MSRKHPVVAVTGSSGAGTSTVKNAMEHIFRREGIKAAVVEGDSFHRYDRKEMKEAVAKALAEDRTLSHFGPEGNVFDKLEELFRSYSETGTGKVRKYLHNQDEAAPYNQEPGTFTPWEDVEPGSDILFYEGLHGGVVTEDVDVAQWVDLLVGVVPSVNLEWIQKIHRDNKERGYSAEAVVETILRRMPDYVTCIAPQFSRTDINFQRVPIVDTSNPFIARDIPTPDESFCVVRFRYPKKHDISTYLQMLQGSWMSRPNTMVLPAGKMGMAMEIMLTPIIHDMMEKKRTAS
ncbi:phosphoribulokinase [Candidatus Tenderia electrophaga]|jgi:phosphoribulokinase|uniref:Phosphoribulokinase n=1 Tax=Candidatus Tenderia electrophaga TaxID=1748243 RepID=A0A0S2TG81_9GAMM|nr:phosphoribulokinase [Candidatus Tenderia electrophaga]